MELAPPATLPRRLFLHDLHMGHGARTGPFAGWDMPLHYGAGVLAEHLHTRVGASLFDVSHMGQVIVRAPGLALEALSPMDAASLPEGRQRYGLLTDDGGGILDDLIVANRGDHLLVVVNASTRDADVAHMRAALGDAVEPVEGRALLALQGPAAEAALVALLPGVERMRFMDVATLSWGGASVWASRSGYTGEDGFELSLPEAAAEGFAAALLARPGVRPAGLGARDSLRLEAGLPLHGTDIDRTTSPVEAALAWSVGKARRAGGAREGGFPGAARVLHEIAHGPARLRVGLRPQGRAPMRGGTAVLRDGAPVGRVTSGTFGPTVGAPVAMAYVAAPHAVPGASLTGEVRGRALPATVVPLPFVPATYQR